MSADRDVIIVCPIGCGSNLFGRAGGSAVCVDADLGQ